MNLWIAVLVYGLYEEVGYFKILKVFDTEAKALNFEEDYKLGGEFAYAYDEWDYANVEILPAKLDKAIKEDFMNPPEDGIKRQSLTYYINEYQKRKKEKMLKSEYKEAVKAPYSDDLNSLKAENHVDYLSYLQKSDPFWFNITGIANNQRNKGIKEYGKGIEKDSASEIVRLTRIEEELVDALYYIEHLKSLKYSTPNDSQ